MITINWKNGFIRIWAVLSGLWVGGFIIAIIEGGGRLLSDPSILGPMFLPPIGLLVIGYGIQRAVRWIIEGFKSD